MAITNEVDPFLTSITLPSACSKAFRARFMKKNSIAVIPPSGCHSAGKHSAAAMQWIAWYTPKEPGTVRTALNGGERKILGYRVDGYVQFKSLVLKFLGCRFHGCPRCFAGDMYDNMRCVTYEDIYNHTMRRLCDIQQQNHHVVYQWECKWNRQKTLNTKIQNFVKQLDFSAPLKIEVRGGRCEVFRHYTEADIEYELYFLSLILLY